MPEAAHPWRVFRDAGFAVDLVSVRGGRPPMDGFDGKDPTQHEFAHLPDLAATRRAADVDAVGYDGIFYVGGHGTMWDFPNDADLARLGRDIYEADGVVAAVCHGLSALVNLTLSNGSYLVEGKEVSAFTNAEEDAVHLGDVVPFRLQTALEDRGAKHVAAPNFECQVSVSERLVTGQNPASATRAAEEVVRLMTKANG
ncbi:type 1 glutamine amidotransferase domain-containing protein [Actinophytocola sp.]|uniref:type 1 glutamine amidotransferase domain-containing protein n=1 Tax=Actinophytocola sp. TaxID=1872138 RepID=UPI002D3690AD|nr:type 1 glutamine amidotransferase domain-containing protein [Actinophytocola sp.]HYQ62791.1 type 1 glutamine amidotransferase domain-containing protein [Actinophytocola sp.]